MVCVENMIQASYDTFYVKIFFSFFVIFNRQWSHGKGFSCQCVVNLRNSIKFWWDFLQCGGHGVVGWFNALSAFRPTFNLMASAGRSSTGNNDFFFWFQLQKCPWCVIYWCPLSKAEALWCLDWSFFSFIISCALCQKNWKSIFSSFCWALIGGQTADEMFSSDLCRLRDRSQSLFYCLPFS